MDHDRQRRLNSDMGRKIRAFFDAAITDADRLPGKAALKAQIAEEFGDVPGINADKLGETFVAFARRAQRDSGVSRWRLRGEVVELTDQLVDRLEKADRLIEAPEPEVIDVGALSDSAQDAGYAGGRATREIGTGIGVRNL